MRKYLFIIIFLTISGCATLNHQVPIIPLEKGEKLGSIQVGFSLHNFEQFALQTNFYYGINKKNTFGICFNSLVFPGSISYIYYNIREDYNLNYQFHLNNILGANYNPTYEFDIAFSNKDLFNSHSFKIGLGLYSTPPLLYIGSKRFTSKLIPIIGYSFQNGHTRFDAFTQYGLSSAFAHDIRKENEMEYANVKELVILKSEIDSFEQLRNSDSEIYQLIITLKRGGSLVISESDPYADSWGLMFYMKKLNAYTLSDKHKYYWIYYSNFFNAKILGHYNLILELDINKVIEEYEETGNLVIKNNLPDSKILNKRVLDGIDDLHFGYGYWEKSK